MKNFVKMKGDLLLIKARALNIFEHPVSFFYPHITCLMQYIFKNR